LCDQSFEWKIPRSARNDKYHYGVGVEVGEGVETIGGVAVGVGVEVVTGSGVIGVAAGVGESVVPSFDGAASNTIVACDDVVVDGVEVEVEVAVGLGVGVGVGVGVAVATVISTGVGVGVGSGTFLYVKTRVAFVIG
jgi:hypothetical protein